MNHKSLGCVTRCRGIEREEEVNVHYITRNGCGSLWTPFIPIDDNSSFAYFSCHLMMRIVDDYDGFCIHSFPLPHSISFYLINTQTHHVIFGRVIIKW